MMECVDVLHTVEGGEAVPGRTLLWLSVLALVFASHCPARAAEPDSELAEAEKTLQEAGVATDGTGLLAFFRQRTPSAHDRARLADTVRRLGDHHYHVRARAQRDLLGAGRVVLHLLRPALGDVDPEIRFRARRILGQIESGNDVALATAACRVLAARKPDGATGALLAYLPLAAEETLEEAVRNALPAVGVRAGKADPALVAALSARHPVVRAAAAFAVGRAGPSYRPVVRPLLKDADLAVRYQAAAALVQGGDRSAVETLIGLVGEEREDLAYGSEDLLYRLAGTKAPVIEGTSGAQGRRKSREAWQAWWKANGAQVDLAGLQGQSRLRGLTLIAEVDQVGQNNQGRVSLQGTGGRLRWEINSGLGWPSDVHLLPNGHVLIAECLTHVVTERDPQGKVVWQYKCGTSAFACQRLPNGNTLIAAGGNLLEVTRAGKTVSSIVKPGTLYYVAKQRNGHILYVDSQNQVVELDARGQTVCSINLPGAAWGSVEKLPNGRYLVCLYSGRKVVEVDHKGKVYWECLVDSPVYATRLPNGRILVGGGKMVAEFDRSGKEVWKQTLTGRVWRVRRY
jgi:hypothetical protein